MRRRLLPALLALTALVLVADLAGAPLGPLRGVGTAVLGRVERAVAPGDDEAAERERETIRRLEDERGVAGEEDELSTKGADSVTARVVGVDRTGVSGPERITLDVGMRDGIRVDRAVIAPDGLVGRVVDVAEGTSDIEVLGSARAAVGIGTLTGSDPTTSHDADELVVTQLRRDRASVGDEVVTLGSPGQRPYPPGISVGRVTSVAKAPGELTDTALVEPSVDLATLDVVAVLTGPTERDGDDR